MLVMKYSVLFNKDNFFLRIPIIFSMQFVFALQSTQFTIKIITGWLLTFEKRVLWQLWFQTSVVCYLFRSWCSLVQHLQLLSSPEKFALFCPLDLLLCVNSTFLWIFSCRIEKKKNVAFARRMSKEKKLRKLSVYSVTILFSFPEKDAIVYRFILTHLTKKRVGKDFKYHKNFVMKWLNFLSADINKIQFNHEFFLLTSLLMQILSINLYKTVLLDNSN